MSVLELNMKKNPPLGSRVVLGFSGGLDTSYCVKYLTEDLGYEVHSIIVNTGGFTDEELKNRLKESSQDSKRCYEFDPW